MVDSNNKERIEVHDASILRNNEHPNFKIGDVINNGYGDFIVKGFTRSFLRLAYVLDNGHKLIGWLTDQVDVKCHLVERNHSEYIRKDFFIEKACKWLKSHYRDYMHNPTGKRLEAFFGGDMCNDFENYMKGE